MESLEHDGLAAHPHFETDETALNQLIERHPELEDTARSLFHFGYAIVDFGFDRAALEEAANYTSEAMGTSSRIHDGWRKNASVRDLAVDQTVLALLQKLYGRQPFPFQTLNFKFGSQQRTHSDTYHFNSAPARFMCGVWVALEDVDEAAGPLHYYPGSHKLPVFARHQLPGDQDYRTYEDYVAEAMKAQGFEKETAMLKAGQAFVWSANLFHGGDKQINRDATRLSQVTHYYFDGCAYYTPLFSHEDRAEYWIRAPYDIYRRQMVRSNQAHLPGRAAVSTELAKRLNVLIKRTPRS